MSNKENLLTVSIPKALKQRLKELREKNSINISSYVTALIRADLQQIGEIKE